MILSAIVIGLVAVIAYVWASRGFFSSMVHMLCVLISGAVALGVWEPLAYLLLTKAGTTGWVVDMAWGGALAVPFAVTLAILRLATNKLLPSNADLDEVSNLVGGGACGLVSGTITVGILVLSVSFLRLTTEIAGSKAIDYENNGSVKRNDKLIFPVDRITAGFYAYLSNGALHTATPLAAYRPAMADDGALLRTNFNEGGSKHTFTPDSYQVLGRYTVGEQPPAGSKPAELLSDSLTSDNAARKQTVTDLNGQPVDTNGARIEGFLVNFKAGAREKSGGIVIGNAQVQLVCRNADDTESIAVHPFAMVSQQEGDKKDLGRWRFDGPRNFFRSAGGASEAMMGFEFLVPRGYTPLAVMVKGLRTDVSAMQPYAKYPWVKDRDSAIKSGNIFSGVVTGTGTLDRSSAVTLKIDATSDDAEVVLTNNFLNVGMLNKDNLKGLEIDESRQIVNGEAKFFRNELNNRGLDRQLQVARFTQGDDTKIVQVKVGLTSRLGMLKPAALAADFSKPPMLVDEAGQRYAAIGYMYVDSQEVHFSFLPGKPVASVNSLPPLSSSRPDQNLILVFRVSDGAKLKDYAIGDKVVATFNPPISLRNDG